ncbi:DUF6713 family protein [Rubrobacter tropicus]|uniref:DUF6713 family protein n=1 Tax=Rubrobacter tropicus TaxID=2653851 RepID=UPI00389AD1F0
MNSAIRDDGANDALILGLDAFFVVHVVLHMVFRNHPENRSGSPFSWALILGAGACGTADLLVSLAIWSGFRKLKLPKPAPSAIRPLRLRLRFQRSASCSC